MNSKSRLGRRGPNKLSLLGSTALVAALGMPGAWAQADDTDADAQVENVSDNTTEDEEARQDTVVVKGIRGALTNAQDVKRNADTFVDSITASDVSTLPDLSVAEALARVPGVVVQRFNLGNSDADFPSPEGSGNLIRGLAFVRSEFNGRDAFSANGGRALDWSSIPPELIGGVDISEDVIAGIEAGDIAFTIDQQQYLQGYLAIVTLYLNATNLNTVGGGLPVNTGPGFVTTDNVTAVKDLVAAGTR